VTSASFSCTKEEIPDLVSKALSGDDQSFSLYTQNYINIDIHISEFNMDNGCTIKCCDRSDWDIINTINDIDDQKLINTIIFVEINRIKHHFSMPQPVTGLTINGSGTPLMTNGSWMNSSLNLQ
jgi:hypothetical protein